jgi:hypothetical protein
MTFWILVAVSGFLVGSCAIGTLVAAVLGRIGTEVAELLEREAWVSAPTTPRSR